MRNHGSWRWVGMLAGVLMLATGALAARAADDSKNGGDGGAWLGIYSQTLTSELREGMEYTGKGVLVSRVLRDSPADRAGLEKGDVIVSVNSRSVETPDDLSELVTSFKPGSQVAIGIYRDGKTQTLNAKLAARDDESIAPRANDDETFEAPMPPGVPDREEIRRMVHRHMNDGNMGFMMMSRGRLGVRVQDLNEDLGGYFKAEKGALVTEVLDDTPAKSAGIKGGDVITRVGDTKVENSSDLIDALRGKKGRVTIEVMRRGERRTIEADLGAGSMGNGNGSRRVYRYEVPEGHARNWSDSSDDDSAALKKEIQDLRDEVRELRRQMETSKK